jgi:UDP-N-acetylglucosamine--dolichyl-phosphate N-acetylglucosaminephosphotransferase
MNVLLLLPVIVAFLTSFLVLPFWIKKARKIGLVWEQMNQYRHPRNAAGSGGLIVILGFILAVLVYVALNTFYFQVDNKINTIFSLTTSILILVIIGIADDLMGWRHGGLSRKSRIILCIFAAIPLIVINAGNSVIDLPFIGIINLGLLYPLIFVPLGIVATSTTFNFLAGFNGLEAGQGIIIIAGLSLVAYITGSSWLAVIGLCMIFALLAFLIFNFYPAKIFPGNVLTYPVGGLIAIMAILGNFEKIAVFFFIPYIIEVVLKLRGKLVKQSFGKPNKDGSLDLAYNKIYSLNHVAILILKKWKNRAYEKEVVYLIWIFQMIIILLGFLVFFGGA